MNISTLRKNISISKAVGYLFLMPPLFGVLYFISSATGLNIVLDLNGFDKYFWFGEIIIARNRYSGLGADVLPGGAGYTSPMPLYLGLMAIAGAYLIKPNRGIN